MRKVRNLVVVTGDVHHRLRRRTQARFLRSELADGRREVRRQGDGSDTTPRFEDLLRQDAHIKFYNNQRGYVYHVVRQKRWQADYRVLDKVSVREGTLSTRASFVVEDARPGINRS